jgi:hypothetical protein
MLPLFDIYPLGVPPDFRPVREGVGSGAIPGVGKVFVKHRRVIVPNNPSKKTMLVLTHGSMDSVHMVRLTTVPLSEPRFDNFANCIKLIALQVCRQPIAALDFSKGMPVLARSSDLILFSLVGVTAVGVLILHQPERFLKSIFENTVIVIKIHTPKGRHHNSPHEVGTWLTEAVPP